MTRKDFLNLLEDILELDENTLNGDEELEGLDYWNSLAMVSFIAMVDENLDITVSPSKIADSVTVQDLIDMVGDKINQ